MYSVRARSGRLAQHIIECPRFSVASLVLPLLPSAFIYCPSVQKLQVYRLFPIPTDALVSVA
eukprot:2256456-Pyramimonas_sp.AAC.1